MLNGRSDRAETIVRSAIRSAYPPFGNQPADVHFTTIGQTDWGAKPHTKCSYSFITPGNFSAKESLARPVDNKIFFAGEACGGVHPNTKEDWGEQMAGAYISGIRAASNALENLVKQDIKKETKACNSQLLALSSVPYRDIFPEHAHSYVEKISANINNKRHIR